MYGSATTATTVYLLLPEIILVAAATALFLVGAFRPLRAGAVWASLAALLVAAIALYAQDDGLKQKLWSATAPETMASGPLVVDLFGHTVRWAILAVGLILVLLRGQGDEQRQSSEASASLLLMTVGLMLIATANELILLFVGLELVSIPTYILLYLGRHDARGQEAASKYFFLSILSSAVLLYGFSFLYGAGGSTRLELIAAALKHPTDPGSMTEIMIPVAMLLMFAGLAFRLTAVPFHFYAPDVYQGTSHANAGLLSTLPKIAGLAALARILLTALPGWEPLGWKAVLVVSILTMTVGNILALWQNNIRRLLAYSSIAHAGYLLIGVAVALAFRTAAMPAPAATTTVVAAATVTDASGKDETSPAVTAPSADATAGVDGLGAAMFYLAVYIFATLGAFAAFVYLSHGERQIDTLDDIAGLNRTHPMVALTVALFMFSLAGVPPLAGFWGKFALLYSALKTPAVASSGMALRPWFIGLAIVAVLNAAIAAAYYLRVISAMYFRPVKAAGPSRVSRAAAPGFALVICTVAVVGVGFLPGRLLDDAVRAGQSLTPQTTLAVAEHADHRLTIKTTQQPVVAAQSR